MFQDSTSTVVHKRKHDPSTVELPFPEIDVYRSPFPQRAGPCCAPDLKTSVMHHHSTPGLLQGSATRCLPAPNLTL